MHQSDKSQRYIHILTAIKIEEPECRVDADCATKLACIGESCQNPCRVSNPCRGNQRCEVKDSLPTRIVACVCPKGQVFGDNGECKSGKLSKINKVIIFSMFNSPHSIQNKNRLDNA